ncbi:Protein AaeX [Halomonadaceae bacterium LMG 33818]|uniref:DUF1656 domain-containing protein n=1 Tax=Cernens ardua TaxID=3402176 RepID=UPI003EDB902C
MPREMVLGDALVPGLLLVFCLVLACMWLIDKAAVKYGVYRYVWHPALFRLSLFTAVFALVGLMLC